MHATFVKLTKVRKIGRWLAMQADAQGIMDGQTLKNKRSPRMYTPHTQPVESGRNLCLFSNCCSVRPFARSCALASDPQPHFFLSTFLKDMHQWCAVETQAAALRRRSSAKRQVVAALRVAYRETLLHMTGACSLALADQKSLRQQPM